MHARFHGSNTKNENIQQLLYHKNIKIILVSLRSKTETTII